MSSKTLKDIFRTCRMKEYEHHEELRKELKAEAIKRAKRYLKKMKGSFKLLTIDDDLECLWKMSVDKVPDLDIGRVEELVEFYNLTMEDLKCQ